MNQEKIIMTFSSGGKTTIEVKGHAGPSCTALTKKIADALGIVTEDVRTREYVQQSEIVETARVKA